MTPFTAYKGIKKVYIFAYSTLNIIQREYTNFQYNAISPHLDTLRTLHVGCLVHNECNSGRGFDEEYFGSSFPAIFLYPEENENDKGIGLSSKISYIRVHV